MSIRMIGIDYQSADVDVRAKFSFTQKNIAKALESLKELPGIRGAVILSTCNRMELWISTDEVWDGSILEVLCNLKGLSGEAYGAYFIERSEEQAVRHLFSLTCGLKSMILAEDQILSQVKTAIALARENYSTDNVLEVLFRKAITAAKKVKTEVVFTHANATAVDRAVEMLAQQDFTVKGKKCMVIGNGEMGKLAAQNLARRGADVTVTVRQYRSGVVNIPVGCKRINYGERMQLFFDCDLIVSATSSPNFTIRRDLFPEKMKVPHPIYLVDLAVPRDIEPEVSEIENLRLYDIDDFKITANEENHEAMQQAEGILKEEMDDFFGWYECRDTIPRIQDIQSVAVTDLNLRIQKIIRKLPMSEEEQENLLEDVDTAAGKVVGKMMFGLRDYLAGHEFRSCLDGLEKLYEEFE